MHNIPENFSAKNWAKEMINKAAAEKPTTAKESETLTKDFSTVTWFTSMFGTRVEPDCTETL